MKKPNFNFLLILPAVIFLYLPWVIAERFKPNDPTYKHAVKVVFQQATVWLSIPLWLAVIVGAFMYSFKYIFS